MENQPHQPTGGDQHPETARNNTVHPEEPSEAEPTDVEEEHDPPREPRIYIADVASAERGVAHGWWVDANQSPEELDADIAALLDSSPTVGASAWAMRGSIDFAQLDLSAVHETALISRLARGVVEHGAAFAAWVRLVGTHSDQLDRFEEFYVGTFESADAWVRTLVASLGWHQQVDAAITDPFLKPYVVIDYEAVLHDARTSWDIVDGRDGKTHVFVR